MRQNSPAYSGGARQAVYDLMMKINGTEDNRDVVFVEGTTEMYRILYNTTKFCFSPHGERGASSLVTPSFHDFVRVSYPYYIHFFHLVK